MTLLRPEFLLLIFIWVPVLLWLNKTVQPSSWQTVIEPELLKALNGTPQQSSKTTQWLLPLICLLITLALAGPALTKGEKTVASQGNLFVILDNSLSMAATDVSPDRSTRAKRMIFDWARSGLFEKTTIITYSASAHTVTPLTSDVNTLETQLQSLNPFIMPEFGNRAELAFAHAANMIEENGYSPPHLLWITDEIAQSKLQQIKAALPASISATLVAAGTSAGSPIPLPNNQGNLMQGDNVVMVKTDAKAIADIGADLGFKTVALGNQPAANFFESIESETIRDTGVIDLGYWLLMPIIIGWLFYSKHTSSVAGIMVFFLFLSPEQSFAAEIFKNKEQRAYDYLEINPARTLELTNTPSLVSEALFRQNQFEQAASALETERSTTALYNRANALAHAGKLKEALNLYTEVLKREDHESARTNKELIESFLENQPSEQSQQQGEDSDNTDSAESSESNQSQQQEDSEQSDESEINDSEDASENEQESENESTQEEQAESTAEQETQLSQQEARENQETEAILNQLNAPSSSILQNKFNLQYQKNPTETDGTLW